jgi:hypothetical protein
MLKTRWVKKQAPTVDAVADRINKLLKSLHFVCVFVISQQNAFSLHPHTLSLSLNSLYLLYCFTLSTLLFHLVLFTNCFCFRDFQFTYWLAFLVVDAQSPKKRIAILTHIIKIARVRCQITTFTKASFIIESDL